MDRGFRRRDLLSIRGADRDSHIEQHQRCHAGPPIKGQWIAERKSSSDRPPVRNHNAAFAKTNTLCRRGCPSSFATPCLEAATIDAVRAAVRP
jgi:hypothetical protein